MVVRKFVYLIETKAETSVTCLKMNQKVFPPMLKDTNQFEEANLRIILELSLSD